MTKAATVVRYNKSLAEALRHRARSSKAGSSVARFPTPATGRTRTSCSPSRSSTCSRWPRRSCKGALARDECRGAHYKPEFAMPGIDSHRSGRASPTGRSLVRPVRSQHPQVAQIDHRRAGSRRRAAVELRRGRHVADSAAAAIVWPGRRRIDRTSLERAPGSAARSVGRQQRRTAQQARIHLPSKPVAIDSIIAGRRVLPSRMLAVREAPAEPIRQRIARRPRTPKPRHRNLTPKHRLASMNDSATHHQRPLRHAGPSRQLSKSACSARMLPASRAIGNGTGSPTSAT